ncbi:MAG TPA: FAD-binding oxidoreductase, partial [Candidatus Binatia bacterium]
GEHVAAALRLCGYLEATVIPWGGGTAMAIGNPPRQADVVVDLQKIHGVVEHDAANLTATVRCGTTLSALQSALAAQKQFAPFDAPFPARATVGGIVAANLNGPRRGCYGSVRDLVIGMKVALAGGEQIKAGGKVVKNVAGYDMCKLFVGSLGTLGLITEVTLRVAPMAGSAATFFAGGDLIRAQNFIDELFRSALSPAAVFLLRDGAEKNWQIAVWCEGFDAAVERQLRELEAMATRSGINGGILSAEKHEEFWRRARDFPLLRDRLIYRVTLPRAAVFDFVKHVEHWNSTTIVSDPAMGTIWLALKANKSALERFAELASMARERRGHAVVFAAPVELKTGINVWGASAATLSLMREIKRQFDPTALLNPGRFVGHL